MTRGLRFLRLSPRLRFADWHCTKHCIRLSRPFCDEAKATGSTNHLIPPKMPEPYECCGNGCDDCVWERYFEENTAYLKMKKRLSPNTQQRK